MVGSNKILTVSYGTFSCTLEGFDDSFDTMKAIAEYFRDLASDDRYFGAEPPTPDAEMLTRIAEREISRRVEARMESSGLVLRATGAVDSDHTPLAMPPAVHKPAPAGATKVAAVVAATQTQTPPSDTAATAAIVGDATEPEVQEDLNSTSDLLATSGSVADVENEVQSAPSVAPPVAPAMPRSYVPAHPDSDSVAAKLQRIRAVVGRNAAPQSDLYSEDLTAVGVPVETAFALDPAAEDAESADQDATVQSAPTAPDAVADEQEFDIAALSQSLLDSDTPADVAEVAAEMAAPDFDEADEGDEDPSADLMSDEDDEDFTDEFDDRFDDETADVAEVEAEVEVEVEVEVETTLVSADADFDEDDTNDDDQSATAAVSEPLRARVIRMKREDFEAALSTGALEEIEDDAETADDVAELPVPVAEVKQDLDGLEDLAEFALNARSQGQLSDDEETDLAAELSEIQAELAQDLDTSDVTMADDDDFNLFGGQSDEDDDDYDEDEDEAESANPNLARSAHPIHKADPEIDDASVSRILSETNAQLNDPDGNRRRAAIAQLKAAVAATEAARSMGEKDPTEDEVNRPFKSDLAEVIRPARRIDPTQTEDPAPVTDRPAVPTRAARPETRTERPRPAPLKLVASQRVDAIETAASTVTPVRPRRVETDVEAPKTATMSATSFADFAADMGATGLSELLEAAAAYTSFVEGLEDFSRPQIMIKVQQVSDEEFSREDSLRSFGMLLRQGRIEKVRNGRFQITEQTRYRPEPRAARG